MSMESKKSGLKQDTMDANSKGVPTEDLPLLDRVKIAEAYNPFEGIAPGWLIDARDTIDNWCVAHVIKSDNIEVLVNYDGWSSKYDYVTFPVHP